MVLKFVEVMLFIVGR